jgi:hypothetical protein
VICADSSSWKTGRYHCAFGRSKAPYRNKTPPLLNPRGTDAAAEAAVYEAVYTSAMSVRGSMPDRDRGKDRRLPTAAGK